MVGLFKKSPEQIAKKKAQLKKKELNKLFKEKKYDKVLSVGSEILEKLPNDHDVLFILGGIYYMRGKHKSALSYFDRVLEISSYDPEVLILKANSLFKLGQFDESIHYCNKIKEIDPKNKDVENLLSNIESSKKIKFLN